jgi:hypothetical protein
MVFDESPTSVDIEGDIFGAFFFFMASYAHLTDTARLYQ